MHIYNQGQALPLPTHLITQPHKPYNPPHTRFFAGEEATPPEVVPRLKAIAAAASPLDATTRILDVGTGAGVLIPYLKALGAAEANVTGVDVSPGMLVVAKRRYPAAAFWEGDVADFPPPAWNASFDAVYMNAVFGNLYDQPAAMEALGALTARGARVVIRCVGGYLGM